MSELLSFEHLPMKPHPYMYKAWLLFQLTFSAKKRKDLVTKIQKRAKEDITERYWELYGKSVRSSSMVICM